jgi:hypothetical protein
MIPQELKGTGAVPFLEYCYKIKEEHTKEDLQGNTKAINNALFKIYEGMRFYSLPFDVSMLVNPIPYPNLTTINFDSEGKCTNPEYINWQQAEERVLFEGWDRNSCYSVIKSDNGYKLLYCDEFVMCFYTINDFITLCNLSEINLTFKK